jgi:hypothetical protein
MNSLKDEVAGASGTNWRAAGFDNMGNPPYC